MSAPRATDLVALRRGIGYSPLRPAAATEVLAAFGIDGTVEAVAEIGERRDVTGAGYIESSVTHASYSLRLADGRVLTLLVETVVYGGEDAEVDANATLIGPDGTTLGHDTVGL